MIDIAPVLMFLSLIAGPVLVARFLTGGEPIDLPELVDIVTERPPTR